MNIIKIATVLGARPQFVKAAVLSRVFAADSGVDEVIIHTGQHYDSSMSEVFFKEMKIPAPKYRLDINGLSHGAMTGQMMEAIEKVLVKEKPHAVLVYGDTNSTLAGALVAKKLQLPLIHVEAGLRSFNRSMPEEINRIVTDSISDLLLCPTPVAVTNLHHEGVEEGGAKVVLSGDIMKDAHAFYSEMASEKSDELVKLGLRSETFVLATLHRQENTDDKERLTSLIRGLDRVNKEIQVVIPLHPRTRKQMQNFNLETACTLIEPLGYIQMVDLLNNCAMVITDSGGLQKEAYFSMKPCVIMREETEWIELVDHGFARTGAINQDAIWNTFVDFNKRQPVYDKELYGQDVGRKMGAEIVQFLKEKPSVD